jgi:acetolactate synthase-1/2/3 large subunit
MHQARRFLGRLSATAIEGPDFVALAKSFGAYAERIHTTEAFAAALDRAQVVGRPDSIEQMVDPNQITPTLRLTDGG